MTGGARSQRSAASRLPAPAPGQLWESQLSPGRVIRVTSVVPPVVRYEVVAQAPGKGGALRGRITASVLTATHTLQEET